MLLHCATIRLKCFNVQYLSFSNPVLTTLLRIKIIILMLSFHLLALWCCLVLLGFHLEEGIMYVDQLEECVTEIMYCSLGCPCTWRS